MIGLGTIINTAAIILGGLAGGVFGISIYFRAKLGESEDRIRQFINTKMEK